MYVDDIIITGCNATTIQHFIDLLGKRFFIKDLGDLTYFLGVEVATTSTGLLLSQRKYITDLLARTNMTGAKSVTTPLATEPTFTVLSGTALLEVSNICAPLALILHMLLISCLNSCYDLLY